MCESNVPLPSQQDIRNQHRYRQQRKQELTRLQETLDKLSKKASFYEEQMDYFQRYVKACLDSLAKAGRYIWGVGQPCQHGKVQWVGGGATKMYEGGTTSLRWQCTYGLGGMGVSADCSRIVIESKWSL